MYLAHPTVGQVNVQADNALHKICTNTVLENGLLGALPGMLLGLTAGTLNVLFQNVPTKEDRINRFISKSRKTMILWTGGGALAGSLAGALAMPTATRDPKSCAERIDFLRIAPFVTVGLLGYPLISPAFKKATPSKPTIEDSADCMIDMAIGGAIGLGLGFVNWML